MLGLQRQRPARRRRQEDAAHPRGHRAASGIKQISAGWDHTCGVTTGGGVKCWGQEKHGEVGDGAKSDRLTPKDVTGLGGTVDQVSAGFDHTCALLTGGTVKCWGNNTTGELGDGTTTDSTHPVTVSGLSGVDVDLGRVQPHLRGDDRGRGEVLGRE